MSEIFNWAKTAPLQPEPITVDIWRQLPEEFCRQVEVVDGQAVRCQSPSRLHQKMTRRLANIFEQAARRHSAETEECLDADLNFDVVLWELPRAHIRRPDVTLYRCAPDDGKPLPAHMALIVVELVSGTGRVETVDKRAEYAAAGIPWYWIVHLHDDRVSSIEMLALDHGIGIYRTFSTFEHGEPCRAERPIRMSIDWGQLRAN